MKKNRNIIWILIIALIFVIAVVLFLKRKGGDAGLTITRVVFPNRGVMRSVISTTGTVLPQNRVEIKPEIGGRVEKVLVNEGEKVWKGRILAWLSSTDRAALIDAARAQGAASMKYWEDAYKPIPIVAPIAGTVIVRSVEPGQSVTEGTPILVLSDRLIVRADVDETDIGRVRGKQSVMIKLDAYPDVNVRGRVGLISYESKITNNVTMYEVDIIPEKVPAVYRSGMSADIDIIETTKENALLLPIDAVVNENMKSYVWVMPGKDARPVKREVSTGIADDQNIEITGGIKDDDRIAVISQKVIPLDKKEGTNPFMPQRPKRMR